MERKCGLGMRYGSRRVVLLKGMPVAVCVCCAGTPGLSLCVSVFVTVLCPSGLPLLVFVCVCVCVCVRARLLAVLVSPGSFCVHVCVRVVVQG